MKYLQLIPKWQVCPASVAPLQRVTLGHIRKIKGPLAAHHAAYPWHCFVARRFFPKNKMNHFLMIHLELFELYRTLKKSKASSQKQ